MKTYVTNSREETFFLGEKIAALLPYPCIVLLFGDLGAGKTALCSGICHALGAKDAVSSPTFSILHCYEGRVPIYHFDWYRLRDEEEFYGAGLQDYFPADGIALVEWPENLPAVHPSSYVRITLRVLDETKREITIESVALQFSIKE